MSEKENPLTMEFMAKVRRIRENTCIYNCYYAETSSECIPVEENGIPNCKREVELIRALENSSTPEQGGKREG